MKLKLVKYVGNDEAIKEYEGRLLEVEEEELECANMFTFLTPPDGILVFTTEELILSTFEEVSE